ncbi:sensor domain-containing diguanylate cyclase [[Enterobacter] lignolyticus]|nr:sensor domain-containing diguanylate cyclase [[Enterobacter] lignolyticus]
MKKINPRNVVLLFFLIVLAPFFMTYVFACFYISKNDREYFINMMSNIMENNAQNAIENPVHEARGLSRSIAMNIDEIDLHEYLNGGNARLNTIIPSVIYTAPFLRSITVSDGNGHHRTYPDLKFKDLAFYSELQNQQSNEKDSVYYSRPYDVVTLGINGAGEKTERMITISMNLFDSKSILFGAISFNFDLNAISAMLGNKITHYNETFILTSNSGDVILSNKKTDALIEKLLQIWERRTLSRTGYFYDNKNKYYVFYRKYANQNWTAFAIISEYNYVKATHAPKKILAIIIILCTIFYIVMTLFVKYYIDGIISTLYTEVNGAEARKEKLTFYSVYENIRKNNSKLELAIYYSETDALTAIFNRRKFDDDIKNLVSLERKFCVALIDIDNFKKINDKFGHSSGDDVLKIVCKMGMQVMGDTVRIYRFGGEELSALYHGNSVDEFYQLIERWRQRVSCRIWRERGLQVTYSAGLAQWESNDSVTQVINKADVLLYKAKNLGKNCTQR